MADHASHPVTQMDLRDIRAGLLVESQVDSEVVMSPIMKIL